MKLEITNIEIIGFKGYKDKQEYQLGHRTFATGDNGLGKSSIGEAIVWALTGCDIWGNEKASTKLVNDKKPKVTEVVLNFLLDEEPQTIIRRKKGSSNEVYWNDKKATTNDISREIFKNKDVFLSIFNPYYFPNLTPKEAKQLLSDVLKPASQEEIFKELGAYLKKLLLDNGFRIPETFMADTRADMKEQEDNILYLEGVQEGLKPIEVGEEQIFDDSELTKLKEELNELNKPIDISNELSELVQPKDITAELNKLMPKSRDAELSELRVEEATLKSTLNNVVLQEFIPVEAKKERKNDFLREYKSKKSTLDNMDHEIIKCERCGNETDLTIQSRERLTSELNEILLKGQKLKIEIEQIEAKNFVIAENNQKIKESKENQVKGALQKIAIKRSDISAEIEAATKKYNEKVAVIRNRYHNALKEYKEKKADILKKRDYIDPESCQRIECIKQRISELEKKQKSVTNFNAEIDAAVKHNEKLVKDQELNIENIRNSKNKIEQLKLAIDAAKQYNSIKLKKQSAQIKPYLDKVEIQFEKLTKDGELKDDFKIVYEGKEFNKLSTSEKIKAGLEIANLLMNIQKLHFPIFIDDAESINVIPELDTQMIMAKVTLDKEIKIEVFK